MNKIKLGYEVGSGEVVNISPSHLIVTGITQLSGKTTTLEALIHRSGFKAIVFKTKIGEKSFTHGTESAPFFRDRSDYEFVRSLIEAYAREKLSIEKGSLMVLCKGSKNLIDIKKRVDDAIAEGKLRGIKEEIYTRLQHYLENLIPQIQYANFSHTLNIVEGVNIMNLERFSEEAQSLIIQSVADEVLKTQRDTVIIVPEAWKFIPQKYNNPCKRMVESFIRQGATNKNFIWIDSQDMAGVDKIPLKSISTWILGYQAERNEVSHTLDQINIPKKNKPKEDEIMSLPIGHFFISGQEGVKKVYVQPVWMSDEDAKSISKGEKEITDVPGNNSLVTKSILPNPKYDHPGTPKELAAANFNKRLVELRNDFFNKIEEIVEDLNAFKSAVWKQQQETPQVDIDEVVSLVRQKLSVKELSPEKASDKPDIDSIIKKILEKLPKTSGTVVYEVAPIEKIKKDFLEEAKNKILSQVSELNEKEKKMLKHIEAQGKEIKANEIITKVWMISDGSSARTQVSQAGAALMSKELIRKGSHAGFMPNTKARLTSMLALHSATDQEIENVYNHILMEML